MWSKKAKIFSAIDWYNIASKIYGNFHWKLNSWDRWIYKRFLPTSLEGLDILDIWWWDGRIYKQLIDKGINRFVILDISKEMLSRCKWRVEKYLWDVEDGICFPDNQFDIVFAFFLILHIKDINYFFEEAYRVLKPWWRFLAFHHIEKRPYEYSVDWKKFMIQNYNHKYSDVENSAQKAFFHINSIDVNEWWVMVGKSYCFIKQ